MRICLDLDGVLCELRQEGQSYADVAPVAGAAERVRALRAAGHTIILQTARHMKTTGGNPGLALARQGRVTLEWLARHGFEYDEIHFGKPHADVYIDDNAVRFEGWHRIAPDGSSLPRSRESEQRRGSRPFSAVPDTTRREAPRRAMNVVIPMAGQGSRFRAVGVAVPKPLIDVRGRPMYAWATESLPLHLARRIIFLCLSEHLRSYPLEEDIRRRYGAIDPVIVPVDRVTEGQACTVLLARELIDNDAPLAIFNADTTCRSNLASVLEARGDDVDGVFGVFRAEGDKWSFARLNDEGRVVECAEKRRISEWASTGLYHFARGRDFVRHADAAIRENDRTNGEFYVAPLYNRLIAEGARVFPEMADDVWGLGTPEDLAYFLANHR